MIFGISTLKIAEMQKILQNKKKSNLGPKMHYLGILGCKIEKVLSYLKLASTNLSKCKVSCKIKNN